MPELKLIHVNKMALGKHPVWHQYEWHSRIHFDGTLVQCRVQCDPTFMQHNVSNFIFAQMKQSVPYEYMLDIKLKI